MKHPLFCNILIHKDIIMDGYRIKPAKTEQGSSDRSDPEKTGEDEKKGDARRSSKNPRSI